MKSLTRHCAAALTAAALLAGCAGQPSERPADPLVGSIVSTADGGFVSRMDLMGVIESSEIVYLGEKHDNPAHRKIQTEVLDHLIAQGGKPVLVFEIFSIDQTSTLLNYLDDKRPPLASHTGVSPERRLRADLGWGPDRDQDWEFYGAMLQTARANSLSAFGMDLPRGIRARLQTVGESGLTKVEKRRLIPTGMDDPAYRRLMYDDLRSAHCGWGTEEYLSRLYDTWVARNDVMAAVITDVLEQGLGSPVVVIVGRGHLRYNEGLYERVAHLRPGVKQVNLGLREVEIDSVELEAYLHPPDVEGVSRSQEHEYLWFTPRVSYEDPCERFRKHPG